MVAAGAGLFVFCVFLTAQGVASQLLSYRLFLRASSFLQLAAFFLILGVYFLTPGLATVAKLAAPENQRLLDWLPSYWFLGLLQELNGGADPVFAPLAARAFRSLTIALPLAAIAYTLAWRRNVRRIVEQPDIAPADRSRPATRIGRWLAKLLSTPLDRAIFLFTARTIARSRQHRLLLAVYGGIGLAIALAYAKSLLYGYSRQRWDELNTPLLAAGLVLLFFAIAGGRAVFAFPIAVRANWIFHSTAIHRPADYFAAARKSLFALTALPVWIVATVVYFSIWPAWAALGHCVVLVATGILLVEISLDGFRKIPFTCSYLPGKANPRFVVTSLPVERWAAAALYEDLYCARGVSVATGLVIGRGRSAPRPSRK